MTPPSGPPHFWAEHLRDMTEANNVLILALARTVVEMDSRPVRNQLRAGTEFLTLLRDIGSTAAQQLEDRPTAADMFRISLGSIAQRIASGDLESLPPVELPDRWFDVPDLSTDK